MGESNRRNKKIIPLIEKGKAAAKIMLIAVSIIAVIDFTYRKFHPLLTITDPARTLGSSDASLKIIEFIDFQCTECARGAKVLKAYLKKYPHDIQLSVKYFPQIELNSMVGAVHAECAARQGMFWLYYDELITKQNQWRLMQEAKPYLFSLARNVSMDLDMFKFCVEDDDAEQIIWEEHRLGESNFVRATPTYFINGKMYVGVDEMEEFLENYFLNKRLGLL
ncbi:MAG: DsbA family protein [Candidatus Omnitrophota bacterium]